MPEALERVLEVLHAAAPKLDATALAEALWLAARMTGETPSGAPDTGSEPWPPTKTEDAERTADEYRVPAGSPARAPSPSPEGGGVLGRALHERLSGSEGRVRGDVVVVPRARPLPHALEVTRALRPWKRPWRTGLRPVLDVEATVNSYARSGELIPAFTAGPERWFDVVVVVDRSPSMQVWQETVDAFTEVLDQLGAFRTLQIRALTFTHGSSPEPQLRDSQGRPTPAGQLRSPIGRRLVVVVSDCTAEAWRKPAVWRRLREWALTTPVALLNPLPAKLWRRTGLDLPTVRVRPGCPGADNAKLGFTLPPLLPPTEDSDQGGWLPIPALSLSPHSLDRWSRTVMLAAPEGCGAVLTPPGGRVVSPGRARHAPRSVEERTEGFLRTATPAAARLAVLCSPFERLRLALLHLFRQQVVPEATTSDIAEVLTAGIFMLDTDTGGSAVLIVPPQVRSRLKQELREHEWQQVRRALGGLLTAHGDGRGGLPVVVRGSQGREEIPAEAEPFGYVLARPAEHRTAASALRIALALLPDDRQPTPQEVTSAADMVVTMFTRQGQAVDRAALLKMLESQVAVFAVSTADDGAVDQWWLRRSEDDRAWDFWERYERYLRDVRAMPPRVIRSLDESTYDVLARLEDPRRPGSWGRTGLVFGQPQSGKSNHYIGLAAAAIDAGYRLIVIVTGRYNSLRSQTQLRVDEGLLGFDSQCQARSGQGRDAVGRRIGAGAMLGAKALDIASLTNSSEKGDFNPRTAPLFDVPMGTIPLVLVVKKNPRIIKHLREWLTGLHGTADPITGERTLQDVPLLVIDDDVDRFGPSQTASKSDESATATSIRRLLASFQKSAYVGYASTTLVGEYSGCDTTNDFVYTLPTPSNYLGPERLFGTPPLVRHVTDHEDWLPARHKADHVPGSELPGTLREAIDAFVLACAARRARGQTSVHNSMLVNVSRFTNVQARAREQIEARVRLLVDTLWDSQRPAAAQQMAALKTLWLSDFSPTTQAFTSDEAARISWEEVAEHVLPALRKIQVVSLSGHSQDALTYFEHRTAGVSVIAIAGANLPQGLTLEGFTVGYLPRSSPSYESLTQVDRWFGYRPGYEDLCRLYTTPFLASAYKAITSTAGQTHNSDRQSMWRYSGRTVETIRFNLSHEVRRTNSLTLERFVAALGPGTVSPGDGSVVWKGVPPEIVTGRFLDSYLSAPGTQRAQPELIAEYVRQCTYAGELGKWTVRLVSMARSVRTTEVAGHHIGLTSRSGLDTSEDVFTVRRLLSPRDESRDLDEDQYVTALAVTRARALRRHGGATERQEPRIPTGIAVRAVRHPDQPLLLIYPLLPPLSVEEAAGDPLVGFAISFPHSAQPLS